MACSRSASGETLVLTSRIKRSAILALALGFSASSLAALAPDFVEKLTSESRPLEDRIRDGARRPYQVMELLGVDAGMTLLDVGAGGGWFTRVLSAATGPSGKVIAQFGPRALQRENGQAQKDLAAALGNTEAFFGNVADLPANSVDAAVTALNMHHMNEERALPYLRDLLTVLKPGGRAAIIDHVGVAGQDNAQLHRMLPEDARSWISGSMRCSWIVQAGFEIVTESDILRTSADDRTLPVDNPILGRDTDQFLFIVRKPQR
jgi:predicted methyltransferase